MKSNEKINSIMIFEMIGKPAEHLKEALEKLVKTIEDDKIVKVVDKKIGNAKEIEKQKGFYSNFAEIEIEVEKMFDLIVSIFKYMPAHIDIISPENLFMTNNDTNIALNELARRLHGYDEVARVLQMQNAQMQGKLKELGFDVKIQNDSKGEEKKK